jgi:hypothetical protein
LPCIYNNMVVKLQIENFLLAGSQVWMVSMIKCVVLVHSTVLLPYKLCLFGYK